jgi:hypothetical protein
VGEKGCSQTRWLPVTTTGRIWASEAPGENEGAGLEGELDAEDGALGEEKEAVTGVEGGGGGAAEEAGGGEGAFGVDDDVLSARELTAEQGEVAELVAGDGGEREREVEDGEGVGEALVEGDDEVALGGVDVLEAGERETQAEEAGDGPGGEALGEADEAPAGAGVGEERGAEPGGGGFDSEVAEAEGAGSSEGAPGSRGAGGGGGEGTGGGGATRHRLERRWPRGWGRPRGSA